MPSCGLQGSEPRFHVRGPDLAGGPIIDLVALDRELAEEGTLRLAGAVEAVATMLVNPVEEEAHPVARAPFPALAILLGVPYTFKVLVEQFLGILERDLLNLAEVGVATGFGEPVDGFPDLLFAEPG